MSSKKNKKFQVIICPDSSEERSSAIEKADSFRKAVRLLNSDSVGSMSRHEFDTIEERDAFIEGYEAGIGYLGDGWYITNDG